MLPGITASDALRTLVSRSIGLVRVQRGVDGCRSCTKTKHERADKEAVSPCMSDVCI